VRKLFASVTLLVLVLAGASAVEAQAPRWTIFTNQTPDQTLDATPGWEVGTKFTSSKAGKVVGFRFWRAAGETGSNYGKLWTNSGTRLKKSKAFPSGTGWVQIYLDTPVDITANTTYRVSVNTNTKQVKRGGAYVFDGPISNGPLYSDGGYYGQPIDAMPTSTSASMFFVDVIFDEYVPPPPRPNLVIALLQANLFVNGQEIVRVRVCNIGDGPAASSTLRLLWFVAPLPSGPGWTQRDGYYTTNALAAGACQNHDIPTQTIVSACNQFHAWADYFNAVSESNENDNYLYLAYCRYY
jgi:Domain of unknown function (DUF4082)